MRARWMSYGVIGLAVVLTGAWVVGWVLLPAPNPEPRYDGVVVSTAADPILRASCYDCHSHETRYAWYTHLPLASLLVGIDVSEGRREMNFSLWDQLSAQKRGKLLSKSLKEIRKGDMPPWYYTPLHPQARMDAAVLQTLQASLQSAGASGREQDDDD